jgi:hypothetical protein
MKRELILLGKKINYNILKPSVQENTLTQEVGSK